MTTLAVIGSDSYKWLLAFHILLAVVWAGSNTAIQIFVIRAIRAGPDRVAYFAKETQLYRPLVHLHTSPLRLTLRLTPLHQSSAADAAAQGCVTFGYVIWR